MVQGGSGWIRVAQGGSGWLRVIRGDSGWWFMVVLSGTVWSSTQFSYYYNTFMI